MVARKAKSGKRLQGKKVLKKHKSTARKSRSAPTPLRSSRHAEEQGMKIFLVAGISIALIVILSLILFYQDDSLAGQAVSISTSTICGDGELCLVYEGSSFTDLEAEAGDSFTVTVVGYTMNSLYSTDVEISYSEYLELTSVSSPLEDSWDWESYTEGTNTVTYSAFSVSSIASTPGDDPAGAGYYEIVDLTFTIDSSVTESESPLSITFTEDVSSYGLFEYDSTNMISTYNSADITIVEDDSGINAPVLTLPADVTITEGDYVEELGTIYATDADGDSLTFTATDVPTDATFTDNGDGTASFYWDSTDVSANTYEIVVVVSDGTKGTDEGTWLITVEEGSSSVYFDPSLDGEEIFIIEGTDFTFDDQTDLFEYSIDAFSIDLISDLEITIIEDSYTSISSSFEETDYTSVSAPAEADLDISWVLTEEDIGIHTFTISVSDGIDAVEETFTITVQEGVTVDSEEDADADGVVDSEDTEADEDSCIDGFDNEGDGLIDCLDDSCDTISFCEFDEELTCGDTSDNDGDDLIDCADDDCDGDIGSSEETCEYAIELTCDDGLDNDADGYVDTDDSDCQVDSDGDGTYDFEDSEDDADSCDDTYDNDGNGLIDCADDGCDGLLTTGGYYCAATEAGYCADSFDNDGNGDFDCADESCDGETGADGEVCEYGTETICDDGYDNNADGFVDCLDQLCNDVSSCEYAEELTCDDGLDNDGDDLVDTDDSDCSEDTDADSSSSSDQIAVTVTSESDGSEVSVSALTSSEVYDVEIVITAEEDLAAHLLLAKVTDGDGNVETLIYQSMAALSATYSEELSFSFTAETDTYTIDVFVWDDWASAGGTSLIDSLEVSS